MKVFSSSGDGMTFEDFLDMMSVFSDNAPKPVKVEYAFRIYGNYVCVVREVCGVHQIWLLIAKVVLFLFERTTKKKLFSCSSFVLKVLK